MEEFFIWLTEQLDLKLIQDNWLSYLIVLIIGIIIGLFLYRAYYNRRLMDLESDQKESQRIKAESENIESENEHLKTENENLKAEIQQIKTNYVEDPEYWALKR